MFTILIIFWLGFVVYIKKYHIEEYLNIYIIKIDEIRYIIAHEKTILNKFQIGIPIIN